MKYKDFLEKARIVHADKYHYLSEKFTDEKVTYVCNEHGEQIQSVDRHLMGYGCIRCSYAKRRNPQKKSLEDFLKQVVEVHGDKYDCSKFVYVSNKTKGTIICKTCHNEWQARPDMFLNQKQRLP